MDTLEDLLNINKPEFNAIKFELVGSRITCNPSPTNTDYDILILVKDLDESIKYLENNGVWEVQFYLQDPNISERENNNRFCSIKKDEINLIITQSESFYNKFLTATEVAKLLNLLNKEDRIRLFQFILYGVNYNVKKPI